LHATEDTRERKESGQGHISRESFILFTPQSFTRHPVITKDYARARTIEKRRKGSPFWI
jgi:hypothetical protein